MEKRLMDYVEVFHENFPMFLVRHWTEEQIKDQIDRCIVQGVPYAPALDPAANY